MDIPLLVSFEVDSFTFRFLQTDQDKRELSSEDPRFCPSGRQELLWAVAVPVLK